MNLFKRDGDSVWAVGRSGGIALGGWMVWAPSVSVRGQPVGFGPSRAAVWSGTMERASAVSL